jgi:subtilisin family serine protease
MLFSKLSAAAVLALSALASATTMSSVESLQGNVIPGKYIVTLKPSVSAESSKSIIIVLKRPFTQYIILVEKFTSDFESGDAIEVDSSFNINDSFKGFSASISESELEKIRAHPDVLSVEEDRIMTIQDVQLWPKNWGLGRVTWRHPKSFKKFIYPEQAGEGVDAYVVDTGCKPDHPEFEGRAKIGASFVGEDGIDKNGHGTHVSGTIAGRDTGIAKKANIICVQVLASNGSGSTAGVVQGINFVAEQAKKSGRKSVANMSLGGGKSEAINAAVASAVSEGVTFVVAAGNSDDDACKYSPASTPSAITVAASTSKDERAYFSNWGSCVDVIAPGHEIYSSWADGEYKTISGTSMASPHVAGIAALYLSQGLNTPDEVLAKMLKKGTKEAITDCKGTPNVMVYSQALMPKKPKNGSKLDLEEDEDE